MQETMEPEWDAIFVDLREAVDSRRLAAGGPEARPTLERR